MNISTRIVAAGGLTLALFLANAPCLRAQGQAVPDQPGVVVQARGPLHEAFAQPTDKDPVPTAVVPQKPPDPIPEEPPSQRPQGDNVEWIPGYWAYDSDSKGFLWVSGFWRVPPPDRKWVPGHWIKNANGWQWTPGFWLGNAQAQLQYLPEPPASVENGPATAAPLADSFYVPGVWQYRDTGYVWQAGYWTRAQPGWVWNSATYRWTPSGYVFVNGYWDYPLANRGLLFAPVSFTQPLYLTAGWTYRPGFAIGVGSTGFFASLFVRPGYGHYYFGDYYDRSYLTAGFQPWYSYGPKYYDPLFSYYRWSYRTDRGWLTGLQSTYVARRDGLAARPARTFVSQTAVVRAPNGATVATTTQLVTPLHQYKGAQLTTVTNAQLTEHRAVTEQVRSYSLERGKQEGAVLKATTDRTRESSYAGPGTARGGSRTVTEVKTTIRTMPAPSYTKSGGGKHTEGGKH